MFKYKLNTTQKNLLKKVLIELEDNIENGVNPLESKMVLDKVKHILNEGKYLERDVNLLTALVDQYKGD